MPSDTFLRLLREQRGMTLEELASKIGTSKGGLHDIESGRRRLTPETREKLAEVLQVPASELQPPPSWRELHKIAEQAATAALLEVTAVEKAS